jgi:hypothetical protein
LSRLLTRDRLVLDETPLSIAALSGYQRSRMNIPFGRRIIAAASAIALFHASAMAQPATATSGPLRESIASTYATRILEGWTVHIKTALLQNEGAATEIALALLRRQLAEIARVVPAPAVAKLRDVPLWFSPAYPGVKSKAEYHPGAGWLRDNGRDPAMVKGVEFTNVREFEKEMNRMPNFALHELAHAYHDRVLPGGFNHVGIRAAFDRAKASGTYDKVERWLGNGRPNTREKAYAMSSPMEYFAESTEAFFSRNDFFPFTREDLKSHDPAMFELLAGGWGENSSSRLAH